MKLAFLIGLVLLPITACADDAIAGAVIAVIGAVAQAMDVNDGGDDD